MLGFKKRAPISLSLGELPSSDPTPNKPSDTTKDTPKRSVGWTLVPPDAASFEDARPVASQGIVHPDSWTGTQPAPPPLPQTKAAESGGTAVADGASSNEDAVTAAPAPPIASALAMEKPVAEPPSGATRPSRFDGLGPTEVPEVFVDPSLLNLVRGVKLPQDESSPVSITPDLLASEPASPLGLTAASFETESQAKSAEPSQPPPSFKLSFKFNQAKPPTEIPASAVVASADLATPPAKQSGATPLQAEQSDHIAPQAGLTDNVTPPVELSAETTTPAMAQPAPAAEQPTEVTAQTDPSSSAPPMPASNKTASLSLTERFIRVTRESKPSNPSEPAASPASPRIEPSSPLPPLVERSSEAAERASSVGDLKPQLASVVESTLSNKPAAEPAIQQPVEAAQTIPPVRPEQPAGIVAPGATATQVEEPPTPSANVPADKETASPRLSKRALVEKPTIEKAEASASPSTETPTRAASVPPSSAPAVESDEYEIVLGARQIAGLAFLFITCLVIFSSVAYLAGEASARKKIAAAAASQIMPQPMPPPAVPVHAETQSTPQVLVESNPAEVVTPDIASANATQTPSPKLEPPTPYTVSPEPSREASPAPVVSGKPIFGTPEAGKLYLQMGAVERGMAIVFVQGLRSRNLEAFVAPGPSPQIFRVLIGPFASQAAYLNAKAVLDSMDLSTFARRYEESLPRPQASKRP